MSEESSGLNSGAPRDCNNGIMLGSDGVNAGNFAVDKAATIQ